MPKNYNLFLKGTVGYWNFNADMVNYVLDKHKDSEVTVLINSLGGDTDTALSISSLFKLHGNVSVHFVGMNASAATISAMGAKHISIDADALFLVHKCSVPVFEWDYMNADELDAHIAELQKMKQDNSTIDGCIAGLYAKRCKKTKDELLALMKEGAWMTAKQAKEWGFVDEITDEADDKQPSLSDETAATMSCAGIPLPPGYTKKDSFMDRFLAFFKSLSSNPAPEASEADANETEGAPTHSPLMAKLSALCALLGVTLSLSEDKKLFLTEEQAATVNDKLDSLSGDIAEKDKTIAELQAQIAAKDKTIDELKKQPAEVTSAVVDTKKDDEDPYAPVSHEEAIAASKAFLGIC